jgi:hypothetical protein
MLDELFDVNVKSIIITENPNDYEEDYYNPDVTNDTMKEEALKEFDASEAKYTSENPFSYVDVDDNTINMMFGDTWDGSYADVTPLVSKAAEELAWQMTMYSSVSDWLNSQKNIIGNDAAVNSGLYQTRISADNIKREYESLTNTISNFKSFGIVSGSSNILWSADNILANMEHTTASILNLSNKVEDIISYIQGNNVSGRDIDALINEQSSSIVSIMSQQNLNNLLANFPHVVADKFMNADYTQNLFTLPRQLYSKLSSILTTLASIQAPTNIESALETIKILRVAVAQMKDVTNMLDSGMRSINVMKSNIASGNYIGVFLQAKDTCKFVEKTSQFAAQYPYNQAYETEGGHLFETDNTPGKERLHIQHCTGTDVEIAPNGDMVSKIKNDCQFIVEKDLQNHVKGNQLMLVDDTSEVQSKTMILTATEDLNISAKTTTYTTDTLTLLTDDTMMTADGNMTFAANKAASFSSVGPLYISSDSQIIMDAPSIIIGDGRASVITLNSLNSITANSVNHSINANTTNVKSNAVFIGEGLIKMNGFITLN